MMESYGSRREIRSFFWLCRKPRSADLAATQKRKVLRSDLIMEMTGIPHASQCVGNRHLALLT